MGYSFSRTDLDRLAKLLGMFTSDFDGEVINAARSAQRLVTEHRATWRDILAPDGPAAAVGQQNARPIPWPALLQLFPANWAEVVRMCVRVADTLAINDRDLLFLRSLSGYQVMPSAKQIGWLRSIVERLAERQEASS